MAKIGGYKVTGDGLKYDIGKTKKVKVAKAHKGKRPVRPARAKRR